MKAEKKIRAKSRRQEERERMTVLKEWTEAELSEVVKGNFLNDRKEPAFHFDKYGNAIPHSQYEALGEEQQAVYVFHFYRNGKAAAAPAEPEEVKSKKKSNQKTK